MEDTLPKPETITEHKSKTALYITLTSLFIIALLGVGITSYKLGKKEGDKTSRVYIESLATPTPNTSTTPTNTPSPQVTFTPTPTTNTTVPTPASKVYTDSDIKIEFTYASNLIIRAGRYTPLNMGDQDGNNFQMGSKRIEVIKDDKTALVINYSQGGGIGCIPTDEKIKVDALFKSNVSDIYLSRNKIDNTSLIYNKYSSSVNGQGIIEGCGYWIDFDGSTVRDDTGELINITIETNDVNQDWSMFDNILKSLKRTK